MKTTKTLSVLFFALTAVALAFYACSDDEIEVPPASTQAGFAFSVEKEVDAETGDLLRYVVSFHNESINALEYHWDFGNGNTSSEKDPVEIFEQEGVYDVKLTVTPVNDGLYYNNLIKSDKLFLLEFIFKEEFDDHGLDTDFPPEGWLLIDADGDGNNWYWASFEDDTYILSRSWDGAPLTPDNWIITPEIDLTALDAGVTLEFDVAPTANTPLFRTENYSVLVSTTGTDPADFQTVFTERLEEDMENWVWLLRSIDISHFAGETIYIAFRHHDSTDNDRIAITNISVFATE